MVAKKSMPDTVSMPPPLMTVSAAVPPESIRAEPKTLALNISPEDETTRSPLRSTVGLSAAPPASTISAPLETIVL